MPVLLPYQDPSKSPDQRTADLLERMTLEEKAGQMCQYVYPHEDSIPPPSALEGDDSTVHYDSSSLPGLLEAGWVGSILSESDPQRLNAIQHLALRSRLGIPLLFGIDAIHGNALSPGAAVFPAPIGLAATWADGRHGNGPGDAIQRLDDGDQRDAVETPMGHRDPGAQQARPQKEPQSPGEVEAFPDKAGEKGDSDQEPQVTSRFDRESQ